MVSAAPDLALLAGRLTGELHTGRTMRALYATDASEYQEMPRAVALPRTETDVRELVRFAHEHRLGLIPRGAGTSLAGQVVGSGIVVDLGRHLNRILAFDAATRRVRVQPGVVRNELNLFLSPHGVFFTPETSTANRAMIGGMVGNNSCGANSIVYGTTREHLVSARGFLSDGSEVTFGPLTPAEFAAKCAGPDTLETRIYRTVRDLLGDPAHRQLIRDHYPKPTVTRRNTGYALDRLMDCGVFDPASPTPFNLCRLLAGSEGTLFLGVEFELNVEPLPPPGALMCAHFATIADALQATLIAMRHRPHGCELIDRHILECTKANLEQARNRFFVQGDPGAVLVIELRRDTRPAIETELSALEAELRAAGLGYAFPVLWGDDCNRVWDLRRAGQGLMNNVVGDAKPREIVEDTAVAVEDLPAYIAEFDALMRGKYGLSCVYYAHAGAGELHTRPLFNLKTPAGLKLFRAIATDVAALVKKYRGSLSGEHGDGRLRGEFIRFMVGDACYALMRRVKETFDPHGIFNPGKIIDTPPMDTSLRHGPDQPTPDYQTIFDFSATQGVLRAAEACTGVGECRKTALMGGTMCPSYMATRNEADTTRARANLLRQVLTHPRDVANPWDSPEVAGVMDLCLSCKGCKSECPSNVDVTRLKAEWQQHYHDTHGAPLRSRLVAGFARSMRLAALAPAVYNWLITAPDVSRWIKDFAGFARGRSLPPLHTTTLRAWFAKRAAVGGELARSTGSGPRACRGARATPAALTNSAPRRVHLFCDEFTDYNDTAIGIKAVELLTRLGYEVIIPEHVESGRAQLSKGLVRDAQALAIHNVELLQEVITADAPLIGIEPSAILGFRDEYPDLVPAKLKPAARALAKNALLIDEFIAREAAAGRIRSDQFRPAARTIKLHGHCHQKALSSLGPTMHMLSLPAGHQVTAIPSGCCGMAGSFGYEAEHFALSQQIGELVLFPAVRAADPDTLIAAPGTSCRHQIKDGTGRTALHPIEILHAALL
ncbi:Anaerobic glycerol-3-phosphate dehydrogenase subunit C [Lacunisphaera limnophila]|uniref:Anaerobic glycerol-3-phosphate dehydrogenase subunit C n=1 Tax=Lacunisphaera limnophila TaxID=1838286 RepID=A0A1I7PI33_9BACT|nr:FAD-binding and (Fe-S)-binding domain-containing protein [Lacunisphaera limnophila]AOS43288.1 Anaerobic glycerol-3-phosphate dehydrogenase subunit C [Lacunisphaera limnophila]